MIKTYSSLSFALYEGENVFTELDFKNLSAPEIIVGAVCQLHFHEEHVQLKDQVLSNEAVNTVWNKLRSALLEISEHKPNFIVFPELAVPPQLHSKIAKWSSKLDAIIVAGTFYQTDQEGLTVSKCPIFFPRQESPIYTEKFVISPFETDVIEDEWVQSGSERIIFRNTSIGDFAVLICSDLFDETASGELAQDDLDFLFVVSCTPDSQRFHNYIGHLARNSKQGFFGCTSNLRWNGHGDGKSAVFAVVDRAFLHKLRGSEITDLEPEQKIWQAKSANDWAVVTFDRENKKPHLTKSVFTRPNASIRATRSLVKRKSEKYGGRGDYRAIGFDLDGTIIRDLDYSWVSLWNHCGDDTLWRENLKAYREGRLQYHEWCNRAVEFFKSKGLTKQEIVEIAKSNGRLTKGFEDGISILKDFGYRLAVISGGIDVFLDTLVPDARDIFDSIFINKLAFLSNGCLESVAATSYDFQGKARALQIFCDEYGLDVSQSIFVGDTFNDDDALAAAGYSIVYADRPKEVHTLTANHRIIDDDFVSLAEHIVSITNPDLFVELESVDSA